MEKNSVKTLADIVLNRRSRAYKELCDMSVKDNIQSDTAAAELRRDLASVLTELLRGNFALVNERLAAHAIGPGSVAIVPNRKMAR